MTPDGNDNPQPDVTADEEWKSRVKAEDAAIDETFRQEVQSQDAAGTETQPPGEEPSNGESTPETPPLPPAEFSTLIAMLSTQSMVALGIIPHPGSGKPEPQPELARHFIDLLGVIETKTKGNLDSGEQALLDNTLHELRMAFVEYSKSAS